MSELRWERWGAASGLAAMIVGGAGGALERGWPDANDTAAVAAFIGENRAAILAQSMLMLASAAIYLWFLAALRSYLRRGEGEPATLSTLMFGSGIAWASLGMVAQAFQVGLAMSRGGPAPAALHWSMAAAFGIANLPLAVSLVATAVLSLRTRVFPLWLGWLTVAAAFAELLLWIGTIVPSGPLAPNGWLTYVLYPLFAIWLVPTAIVMLRRIGKSAAEETRKAEAGRRAFVPQH